MSKKLVYLFSFVLFLCLNRTSAAEDVDPSLVGWWKFDEGFGDVALDSSGNNNEVTLLDGPTWGTDPEHRGILVFDGDDDHAYIEGTPFELPTYTIALWFRVDGGSGSRDILSAKGPSGVNGVLLEIQGDGTLRNLHRFPFASGGGSNIYTEASYDDGSWHHAAAVKTASEMILYVDGQQVGTQPDSSQFEGPLGEIWLGTLDQRVDRMLPGAIDDLRIYNRALSEQEIATIMEGEANPLAYGPQPPNGEIFEETWANLKWGAGDYAVSHDLYFGTSFDDVNEGAEGTFVGNTASGFQVVGFPGFPAPDGLQFGTIYYWRVDEVNELHPDSPWKGEVWSFAVPPQKAYSPAPPDGARFLDPELTLGWMPAFGTKLNYVYFGENFDDVNNAAGGAAQAGTAYDPGPLELEKTYYWRVDEFDGAATYRGDVWSFTTTAPGGGLKGEYFNNTTLSGEPVLTRIDPGVDFSWADSPEPNAVNADNFSVRWRGEVEIAFSEAYRFYGVTEDSVRLWINDQLVIDRWDVFRLNEYRTAPIELQAGQRCAIEMWSYNDDAGATAQLLWESAHQPKGIIPAAAFWPPVRAGAPRPASEAVDVRQILVLKWIAGEHATEHDVYFGKDADAVAIADVGTAGIYQGRQAAVGFSPVTLDWDTTYYWRVDEINDIHAESPWVGNVWGFTTADFLVVDDFEDYDTGENQIWYAWNDGLGYGTPGTEPYSGGNGTGSAVGWDDTPSYTEETIVHGGNRSMPFTYDNSFFNYSEAEMTLSYPRDWTENGVGVLSLWFRGNPAGFIEEPAGTYRISASGTDISDVADEFRYAFKQLSGGGSIVAKVESVENTDGWAKAGVMIRETLEPGSKHSFVCITPGNGVAFEGRITTGASSFSTNQTGITAPYWVKLERDAAGNFTGYHSADGVSWQPIQDATPRLISMSPNVYIGLALTSHSAGVTCTAEFSNVKTSGTVTPMIWSHEAIGTAMLTNDPEPMYVALNGSAVVTHDNPNAAQIGEWTEWTINLSAPGGFADQGVNLANVNTIALGFGDKKNPQPGGSGTMYFDDIRLYRPAEPAP